MEKNLITKNSNDLQQSFSFNGESMTVKQVAETLGVSYSSIDRAIDKLFPDIKQNGKTTYLNEGHVTAIKLEVERHHNLFSTEKVTSAQTDLEMLLLSKKVDQWKDGKIATLQSENEKLHAEVEEMKPKAIQYDSFLSNESHQRIGDVAKMFGLKSHKLFQMLRDAKILKENYVPYEPYEHHFKTVETPVKGGFNVFTSYIKPSGVDYIAKRFNLQKSA